VMESESIALPLGDTPVSNTHIIISDTDSHCQAEMTRKLRNFYGAFIGGPCPS
jgi:hypothetical protein